MAQTYFQGQVSRKSTLTSAIILYEVKEILMLQVQKSVDAGKEPFVEAYYIIIIKTNYYLTGLTISELFNL